MAEKILKSNGVVYKIITNKESHTITIYGDDAVLFQGGFLSMLEYIHDLTFSERCKDNKYWDWLLEIVQDIGSMMEESDEIAK